MFDRHNRMIGALYLCAEMVLTCLWALEGRNTLNSRFRRWRELDLQYIDNQSPAFGWKIMIKTIPTALLGHGAS